MVAAGNSSFTVHIGYCLLVWDTHKNCRPILWFTLYLVFVDLNWLKVPPRVTCKENTWKCLQVVVGTSCYYCLYLWPWMARFIVSLRKTKAAYMLITCLVHLVQNIFYLFADHFWHLYNANILATTERVLWSLKRVFIESTVSLTYRVQPNYLPHTFAGLSMTLCLKPSWDETVFHLVWAYTG